VTGAPASSDEEGYVYCSQCSEGTLAAVERTPSPSELAGHPRVPRCSLAAAPAYSAFRSRSVIYVNALQPACFDYYKVRNN